MLVRVHAASVHPDVWHVMTGQPYFLRLGAGVAGAIRYLQEGRALGKVVVTI
jgi:hypothetical protein